LKLKASELRRGRAQTFSGCVKMPESDFLPPPGNGEAEEPESGARTFGKDEGIAGAGQK